MGQQISTNQPVPKQDENPALYKSKLIIIPYTFK